MFSCEEEFVLNSPDFKPSIVVNSIFSVGKSWRVSLSYSRNRLDMTSQIRPIEDAEVEIVERSNNRIILLHHIGKGIYTSDIYPPLADKTYQINVNVDGYETVTAKSMAPTKARVEILSDVVEKLEFEIKNTNQGYYIWDLVYTDRNNSIDTTKQTDPGTLVKGVKNYNNINSYLKDLATSQPNDSSEGGVKTAKYSFDNEKFEDEQGGGTEPNQILKKYLRLLTSSKELYEYYKAIEKFNVSENHNCSFCQTPEINSNVVGGLGIFAGYTEEFKEIK
jgi:hypothetical protein